MPHATQDAASRSGRDLSGRWVRVNAVARDTWIFDQCGSSITTRGAGMQEPLRSEPPRTRRRSSPSPARRSRPAGSNGPARARDEHSGRGPGLEWRPRMRDERRADPLLPSNSHPHRFRRARIRHHDSLRDRRCQKSSDSTPSSKSARANSRPRVARLSIVGASCCPISSVGQAICRAHAESAYVDWITTDSIRRDGNRGSGPKPNVARQTVVVGPACGDMRVPDASWDACLTSMSIGRVPA